MHPHISCKRSNLFTLLLCYDKQVQRFNVSHLPFPKYALIDNSCTLCNVNVHSTFNGANNKMILFRLQSSSLTCGTHITDGFKTYNNKSQKLTWHTATEILSALYVTIFPLQTLHTRMTCQSILRIRSTTTEKVNWERWIPKTVIAFSVLFIFAPQIYLLFTLLGSFLLLDKNALTVQTPDQTTYW